MNLNSILRISPFIEIVVRNIYWRSAPLVKLVSTRRTDKKKAKVASQAQTDINRIVENLSTRGVKKGDILIVHSAFRPISRGSSPSEVCAALKSLVGNDGTLVLPAIPLYENNPSGVDLLRLDVSNLVCEYDPVTTKTWTGALATFLMTHPEAKRSLHPLNSVVALGPHAEEMLQHNLDGDRPTACGVNSSWYYCAQKNAKIVALGVDMAHSLTMIHVAEDADPDAWCVPDWYRDRKFSINFGDHREIKIVRERSPKWGMLHYAERTLDRDLCKAGILTKEYVGGVEVSMLNSKDLLSYLTKRNHNGYPYYMVPKKG